MKSLPMTMLVLAFVACLIGCGGGNAPSAEPEAAAGGGDPGAQLGPEEMPDPETQPLEFLHWRIDRMFERDDGDGDGRISLDEYSGEAYNFERIDANADGYLTKQEVVDDVVPTLREEGKIP